MIAESGKSISHPTRVEVLNWLLYKCTIAATTKNNPGSFKPTSVYQITNLRSKMVERLHEKSIGNFSVSMEILTNKESESKPESFIGELKNKKMLYQGLTNIENVFDIISQYYLEVAQLQFDDTYICSSMCWFPTYEIDFGWGKPVKVTLAGNFEKNSFILMDTPNMDGIEALVCLQNEDMAIILGDHDLLTFC